MSWINICLDELTFSCSFSPLVVNLTISRPHPHPTPDPPLSVFFLDAPLLCLPKPAPEVLLSFPPHTPSPT